ncbi:MAG: hypothetical protein KatS3mg103_0771 [Phycisphaerales bacterium]|nr:MAG: hypothetical protein KatS3mg103_0771 [Phycisphaerales bacterium]
MTDPAAHDRRAAPHRAQPDEPAQPGDRLSAALAWLHQHRVPVLVSSAAVSLLVHLLVLLIAALIHLNRPPAQLGASEGQVEFAVMSDQELAEIVAEQLDVQAPSQDDGGSALELQAQIDLGALEFDPTAGLQDQAQPTITLGGGDLEGVGLGVGESLGASASFFGVEARGNRFAFVVDTSGSMVNDGRLLALQRELVASIEGLFKSSNFFVALFSTGARPLGDRDVAWTQATDRGKAWARQRVMEMQAEGGTNPLPGFQLVAMLDPPPDAVYFMTDGEFNPDDADQIIALARRLGFPVHCITLRSRAGEAVMRRIAVATEGTYAHVEDRP